jgi:hypothetical protein
MRLAALLSLSQAQLDLGNAQVSSMKHSHYAGLVLSLLPLCLAQFPPTPTGLTKVTSKVNQAVKISYKQVVPLVDRCQPR